VHEPSRRRLTSALSRCVGGGVHRAAIDRLPDLEGTIGIVGELTRSRFELVRGKAPLLQDATTTRGEFRRVYHRRFNTSQIRHRRNERRVAYPGHDLAAGTRRKQDREESRMSKPPHCGERLAALHRAVKAR
jgi:hypothetical protein